MRTIILAAVVIAAPIAKAEIYKCVVGGKTTFSQQPCAPDAVEVKPKVVRPSASSVSEQMDVNASVMAAGAAMEKDRRMREIDRAIADLDARIAQLEAERNGRIMSLRISRLYANNNLAGATWEQSLATEMEAVAKQYDTSIRMVQEEKKRLLDEYARLRDTASKP